MELSPLADDLHDPPAQQIVVAPGLLPDLAETDQIDADDLHINQQLVPAQLHLIIHSPGLLRQGTLRLQRPSQAKTIQHDGPSPSSVFLHNLYVMSPPIIMRISQTRKSKSKKRPVPEGRAVSRTLYFRLQAAGTTQVPLARQTSTGSSSTSAADALISGRAVMTLWAVKVILREVFPTETISPLASM